MDVSQVSQAMALRADAVTRDIERTAQNIDKSSDSWKAAQEFESLVLSQMFEFMFAGVKTDGMFGGGNAEKMYRSFLLQGYADSVAENGSIGIAERVYGDIMNYYGRAEGSGDE
ncbi:rod-binding protein [Rhodospirillaceae bacterium SYSU D60014]|uniref:rod-binding protein n=1 Tax=Virgifigura deserti TaxID=2268457 RepID=UPI000E66FBE3